MIDLRPIFFFNYRKNDALPTEWSLYVLKLEFDYLIVSRGTTLFIKFLCCEYKIKFPNSIS
jgi:hypothetical protein